ncbi:MAG TPA: ATP-binding cassette domain-containing protein [Firmicutes bacterium]|nr:ATP-binding cassette domain-containing protein [Bacillota bacterium]
MIEVKNLVKLFGSTRAVDDISFTIEKGEVVGLLGPNGAGKSTAMRMLTCYLAPDSGEAKIGGYSILTQSLEVRSILGYLPESAPLYQDMNAIDYLNFIANIHGLGTKKKPRIDEMVEVCGLKDVVYKDINELSKGYRQRVGLASSLIHDPDYLILDEPTTGLDPNQIVEIRSLIRKLGKDRCVILSTHILPEVEVTCDRAIIIDNGKIIAEGTTTELTSFAHGADVYHVGVLGNRHKVEDAFSDLDSIKNFSLYGEHAPDRLTYAVTAKAEKDISEEIFDLAVAKGFKLTELRRETARLEDIFRTLTTKEAGLS